MLGTKVITPQNVIITLNTNILAWRVLAFLIDTIVIILYTVVIINMVESAYGRSMSPFWRDFLAFFAFLPIVFYSLFLEFFSNGFTIGKLICGIRVIKINGLKCGFDDYLMRWIFRLIDIFPALLLVLLFEEKGAFAAFITGIPALISIAVTKNHQRIGDIVAGTTVVKLKQKHSLSNTIFKEISTDYEPEFPQVIKLSDNDMRIIQEVYKSAKTNRNYDVIKKLRSKVENVMQIESPYDDIKFLDKVIFDFNHYTQNM